MQALQQGSCKNKVIRAMFAGPECVGKSSIMRVFTQQQLAIVQDPTQIADQSDKMVYLKVYKIKDRTTYDIRRIWDNNVQQIVQKTHDTQINSQQIGMESQSATWPTDRHLLINDQHAIIQSAAVYQDNVASTTSPDADGLAVQSTDSNMSVERCREFFQYYYQTLINTTTDDSQYAKIWDFGGQSIYHVTHQPFLSGNSMYILVFNIEQNIDDRVVTRDGKQLNITYLQSMQEWLTSIIGGNANQAKMTATIDNDKVEYSLPIVILVASHGDCITSEQDGIDRFKEFERQLTATMPRYKSNIYSSRIIFNCNPDDISITTLADRERCSLRLHEIMKSFVQSLPFMCNDIPIRWYIMATLLHKPLDSSNDEVVFINGIRDTRVHKIMTIQEIASLATEFGLYEDNDKLLAMLRYLHDLGEVIFCNQADSIIVIVTDVDWLLRIFRAIIQLHNCPSGSFEIQSLYDKASLTGKISTKYIDYVLEPYNLNDETKTSIIKLMESYDILCTIKSESDDGESHYFVPYLLRPDVKVFDLKRYHVSKILYIGYERDDVPYIPDGIYYCLLSSCLKEWNNTKVELYYQCAKFYLKNGRHYIIIKKDNSHIALQYCYQKSDNPVTAKSIKSKVETSIHTDRPHETIKQKLSLLIKERMPRFKKSTIRNYVRCNECRKLTFLENSNNVSRNDNLIQCENANCNMIFESESITDWMFVNGEYKNGKHDYTSMDYFFIIHNSASLMYLLVLFLRIKSVLLLIVDKT